MEKSKVVVDASVVVKWFIKEKYSDIAIKLRNDYVRRIITIAVPSLLEYEVLNALRYSGLYTIEEIKQIGLSLNKYGFETYDLEGEFKSYTIEIAEKNDVTIYDASYIALAGKLDTILYTADTELIKKFPNIAIHIERYRQFR